MGIIQSLTPTITLLIVLSILVIAHEWGHFVVARLFGIRVDDFSIGFGKRLIRIGKRGDTEYNIRMLPLGGFVKIAGMEADEEPLVRAKEKVFGAGADPDATEIPLVAENTAEAEPYNAPDAFNSKPIWQRALVILAGPLMSFLLGYFVFCMIGCTIGIPTGEVLNKVEAVQPGGEGQRIGLQAGDEIVAIDGKPMQNGTQMVDAIHDSAGKLLALEVRRGNRLLTLHGTPQPLLDQDGKPSYSVIVTNPGPVGTALGLKAGDIVGDVNDAEVQTAPQLQKVLSENAGKPVAIDVLRGDSVAHLTGRYAAARAQDLPALDQRQLAGFKFTPESRIVQVGLRESIKGGNAFTLEFFRSIGQLITHHQLRQNAHGIIGMYKYTAVVTKTSGRDELDSIVMMLGQLSISLAIFNILPIPILDGGHLLTFFIEWLRRGRKLTPYQQQAFLMTGLAIIGVLFVLIMTNDILQTIHKQFPQ